MAPGQVEICQVYEMEQLLSVASTRIATMYHNNPVSSCYTLRLSVHCSMGVMFTTPVCFQGALPLSFHFVAIHSPSVQRLNACIAFGKHISPNVTRTPAVHFAPVQCHAVATVHNASSLLTLQSLTGTATSLAFSHMTGIVSPRDCKASHPVCSAGLHVPV